MKDAASIRCLSEALSPVEIFFNWDLINVIINKFGLLIKIQTPWAYMTLPTCHSLGWDDLAVHQRRFSQLECPGAGWFSLALDAKKALESIPNKVHVVFHKYRCKVLDQTRFTCTKQVSCSLHCYNKQDTPSLNVQPDWSCTV